jgi:glycine/D-amino acid oxidase-like deaminating enzyme
MCLSPAALLLRPLALTHRSAQLHPLKLVNGLAEVCVRRLGVKIYEMSHVLRVDESVNGEVSTGGQVRSE